MVDTLGLKRKLDKLDLKTQELDTQISESMVKISKILHETVSVIQETLMPFTLQYVKDKEHKHKYFDAGTINGRIIQRCAYKDCFNKRWRPNDKKNEIRIKDREIAELNVKLIKTEYTIGKHVRLPGIFGDIKNICRHIRPSFTGIGMACSHKDGTGGQCSFNQCPLTCKLVKWMIEKKGD